MPQICRQEIRFGANISAVKAGGAICPEYEDMTVQEFAHEHPYGVYLLALDTHIVCVFDGRIVDTWNSGGKTVLYYWMED